MPKSENRKLVIGITGATGFVGQALMQNLSDCYRVGFLRTMPLQQPDRHVEYRKCDLLSLKQTLQALQGIEIAIYLVHSMLPSSRLFQGNFRDTDLLIADNFARAAKAAGVQRIIYLGGLSQSKGKSEHLKSRFEVEEVLRASGIPLTTLRAGIIVGERGSSFQMIVSLVNKLPWMVCPQWTETKTEAIAISDVIKSISYCIENSDTKNKNYDLGSGEVISYRGLIQKVANSLGLKRTLIRVRFFSPRLSVLWVHLVTHSPAQLIKPLVASLKTPMVADEKKRIPLYYLDPPQKVDDAIREAVNKKDSRNSDSVRKTTQSKKVESEVRSVQRLHLPDSQTLAWIAAEYMRWLPQFLSPIIKIEEPKPGVFDFKIKLFNLLLLQLEYDEPMSPQGRIMYLITNGILVSKKQDNLGANPRLEFRYIGSADCVIACIHNYRPSLPWYIYKFSQAVAHKWVMKNFEKHLKNIHVALASQRENL